MARTFVPRSFATHDSVFHADEVTAAALLLLCGLIDEDRIVRTRDVDKISSCEYICDVGGVYDASEKLFDHHQAQFRGPLSSAGMVLKYLADEGFITADEYDHFNESLVTGVDAEDNGKSYQASGLCTFSAVIANYNPIDRDCSSDEQDAAFMQACGFALGHLSRLRRRLHYVQSCKAIVETAMANGKECLVFEKNIPWIESFFELGGITHPAQFVIMPAGPHWKLRGVPPTLEKRMQVRLPLPQAWAGLLENDLKKVCGIPGAVFCHKGRFISVWETKEDAMKALEYVLKTKRSSHANDI